MHSLEEVRAEYDRLDRLCGIDTSGIELKISKRAVKQLGSFRSPRRGGKDGLRITLSYLILEDDEQFWDTVRHEYAHAAVYLLHPGERHGHDKVWKDMCAASGAVLSGSRRRRDRRRRAAARKQSTLSAAKAAAERAAICAGARRSTCCCAGAAARCAARAAAGAALSSLSENNWFDGGADR